MIAPRPEDEIVRARQKSGARVTAILLIAFVVLTFAITIAKLTVNR
ncbi:hypothetical protein M8312_11190 [Sphingomonas sp. KRR8]|jgi:hypothetical protein|nr:hypothetical protein [Sphingomonas sp. KRR8]URD60343.1 hypothetical protein M8312_11190 [Sphingomonas sp. KRR8]